MPRTNRFAGRSSRPIALPATPMNASVEQLAPPTLFIGAECDARREKGEAYARKLVEAGVVVMATRYLGTNHGIVSRNRLAYTPAVLSAIAQAGSVGRHLRRCHAK